MKQRIVRFLTKPRAAGVWRKTCLLLGMLLLLPSCAGEIADPLTSEDVGGPALFAPLLSEEEADALFGTSLASTTEELYGNYYYFFAPISKTNEQLMAYRYNLETGETEYACQDPTCTHTTESCPFGNGKNVWQLVPFEDGLISTDGQTEIQWYNFQTRETKILAKETENLARAGKSAYYDNYYYRINPDGSRTDMHQLWRIDDPETGAKTLVAEVDDEKTPILLPFEVNGEEIVLAFSSIDPEGNSTQEYGVLLYCYRIDPATGKKAGLFNKSPMGDNVFFSDTHYMHYDYDVILSDPNSEEPNFSSTLCLTDVATGETTVLLNNDEIQENNPIGITLTDRCAMWLTKDLQNKNKLLLHCYDYIKGETREYSLEGRWSNTGYLTCCRGRLITYMAGASDLVYDEEGNPIDSTNKDYAYLVVWDILTGKQQVFRNDGTESTTS